MTSLSALEAFAGDPTAVPHLATCSGCEQCSSFRLVIIDSDTGDSVRIPRAAARVVTVDQVEEASCTFVWKDGIGGHSCMKRAHAESERHRCECDAVTP